MVGMRTERIVKINYTGCCIVSKPYPESLQGRDIVERVSAGSHSVDPSRGYCDIAGTIVFADSLRSHADHPSNKLKSAAAGDPRPTLRLTLSGAKNTDETLIYTDPGAKNGFDDYDSDKWFTGSGVELFTFPMGEKRELVINGLSGISDEMEITLGFSADKGGAFSFRAKEIANLDDFDLFLNDKWTKTLFDLRTAGSYDFTSGSSAITDRFSLIFRAAGSTPHTPPLEPAALFAYAGKEGAIVVKYSGSDPLEAKVFDIAGRLVALQTLAPRSETILNARFAKGIYLLQAGKHSLKVVVQ
jgi:hypothetical protein